MKIISVDSSPLNILFRVDQLTVEIGSISRQMRRFAEEIPRQRRQQRMDGGGSVEETGG